MITMPLVKWIRSCSLLLMTLMACSPMEPHSNQIATETESGSEDALAQKSGESDEGQESSIEKNSSTAEAPGTTTGPIQSYAEGTSNIVTGVIPGTIVADSSGPTNPGAGAGTGAGAGEKDVKPEPKGADQPLSKNPAVQTIEVEGNQTPEISLELVQQKGAEKRFATPYAITKTLSNVFTRENGLWNYPCNGLRQEVCASSLFTPEESAHMGGADYDFRVGKLQTVKDYSLTYLRALRAGAGRECDRLIQSEWSQANPEENLLVKEKTAISEETILQFMKKLLGIPDSMEMQFPAKDYSDSFSSVLGKIEDRENLTPETEMALQQGFQALCIALVTDPLVFVY